MNVFLYVFDSLRPDHLSWYGYDRAISPAIDGYALPIGCTRFTPSNTHRVGKAIGLIDFTELCNPKLSTGVPDREHSCSEPSQL